MLIFVYIQSFISATTRQIRSPRQGQGLIEYVLIITVVAAAGIAGLVILGPRLQSAISSISSYLP